MHKLFITLFFAMSWPALGAGPEARDKEQSFRDMLTVTAEAALRRLGRDDGFARSERAHIVIPERLSHVASRMRRLGMGRHVDALETSLNRAAETAVPTLHGPIRDAIARVPFNEAESTKLNQVRYFQRHTAGELGAKLLPQVRAAASRHQVMESYQQLSARASKLGLLRGETPPNLEEYITAKALDALYATMADEEKALRHYPSAQAQRPIQRVSKQH